MTLRSHDQNVYVGLSGGVDSAVCAALLVRQGYQVTGVFIKITIPGYPCTAVTDRQEAMRVAAHLRIPFQEIDLSAEYTKKVFEYTLREYAGGLTPNPDTLCNKEIKFGLFFEYARGAGADFVATGHYAQLKKTAGGTELYASVDTQKDQTYFLWMVKEELLKYTLFPVGDKDKPTVRQLARKYNLPNAERKDSQGLCFLGPISMDDMLTQELHPKEGGVVSEEGVVLGTHRGAQLYTLGQRHGFLIDSSTEHSTPWFVIEKNIKTNTLVVAKNPFPQNAIRTEVQLAECNWIGKITSGTYESRYRYRQKLIPATLTISKSKGVVTLHEPHYIPLGQSLVLYKSEPHGGSRCIGGGVIEQTRLF